MRYVFDLDGTLVDNRRAITEAYQAAGVHEVPFSISWKDFCTAAQHKKKAGFYPEMLRRYAKPTELHDVVSALIYHKAIALPITILTGASPEAVTALCAVMPMLAFKHQCRVLTGQTPHMKANYLSAHGWGTYVDDDAVARRIIQELTTWRVLAPSEVVSPPSSWPPVQILGSARSSRLVSSR